MADFGFSTQEANFCADKALAKDEQLETPGDFSVRKSALSQLQKERKFEWRRGHGVPMLKHVLEILLTASVCAALNTRAALQGDDLCSGVTTCFLCELIGGD